MFGLSTFKLIAVGVVILAAIAYVATLKIEVGHYKKSALEWESKYTEYRAAAESNAKALGSANSALTLQAKQDSIAKMQADNALKLQIQERIKNDQVSAHIRIPDSVLRLQHDTTTNTTNVGQPPGTISGHAPDTEPPSAGRSDAAPGGTVQDLLAADAINNPELNSCVDEVIKWNKFWDQFVQNIKAVEHANP